MACVAVVAAGSAASIADRWRSLGRGFERGVVFGGAGLVAMLVASALPRARSRVPRDRIDARRNARPINVVAIAAIAVAVVGAPSVLFSARWALRR